MVKFNEGENTIRAIGHIGSTDLTDELRLNYQTTTWGKPARLVLKEIAQTNALATVQVQAFDKDGVLCLDAANLVRFGLTGDGRLLDNLGTVRGSRAVQLADGKAQISLQLTARKAVVSVASEGLTTQFLNVTNAGWSSMPRKNGSTGGKPKVAVSASSAVTLDVAAIDRERILKAASAALTLEPITITRFRAKFCEGGPNDFYSNGDYWWPDPTKPDGLPYLQRDGETNPGNFNEHRTAMRSLRDAVAALGAAYQVTGEDRYAMKAAELLRVFFLDPTTRMNPHLNFAQAIPGRSPGRGIGIIDTLHLAEVPLAIEALAKSPAFPPQVVAGLKQWFREYSDWMITS
jgi:hypothetical protein